MCRRTSIVIVILGLIGACVLYRFRPQREGVRFPFGSPQPELISKVDQEKSVTPLKDHPALAPLTVGKVTTERTAAKSLAMVRTDLERLSAKWLAAEDLEPQGKDLLEEGLRLMRVGSLLEAREAFQLLINTYTESRLVSLAYWAIGLAFYQEGGNENLLEAADQFK